MRALKQNAELALAEKAREAAHEKWKNFSFGEMDVHRAAFGDGDPEGWSLLKMKEDELKDDFEKACVRLRVSDEEALAKKQRVM